MKKTSLFILYLCLLSAVSFAQIQIVDSGRNLIITQRGVVRTLPKQDITQTYNAPYLTLLYKFEQILQVSSNTQVTSPTSTSMADLMGKINAMFPASSGGITEEVDPTAVKLTGDQTVAGNKTFTGTMTIAGFVPNSNGSINIGSTTARFLNAYAANFINPGTATFGSTTTLGPLYFRQGTSSQLTGGFYPTTGNFFTQSPGVASADNLAGAQFSHSIPAATGIARGVSITPTLTATANGDNLYAVDIAPTYVPGVFTGVSQIGLKVTGATHILGNLATQGVIPFTTNAYDIGSPSSTYRNGYYASTVFTPTLRGTFGGINFQNNAGTTLMQINSAGSVLIQNGGTYANSGEQFQVVGSAKLDGAVRTTGVQTLSSTASRYDYNTVDETTNYERVFMGWSGNTYSIILQKGGSGSDRALSINSTVINSTSNVVNIGGGYNAGNPTTGLNAFNGLIANAGLQRQIAALPTIAQTGTAGYNIFYGSAFEQSTGSGVKNLIDVGLNTGANGGGTHTSKFRVTNTGRTIIKDVPVYADNAAATTAGLEIGTLYRTATGSVMIVY